VARFDTAVEHGCCQIAGEQAAEILVEPILQRLKSVDRPAESCERQDRVNDRLDHELSIGNQLKSFMYSRFVVQEILLDREAKQWLCLPARARGRRVLPTHSP